MVVVGQVERELFGVFAALFVCFNLVFALLYHLAPGSIAGGMMQSLPADKLAPMVAQIPMRRQGTPWEIANAIVFLLSDDASYITGTELIVDGGLSTR